MRVKVLLAAGGCSLTRPAPVKHTFLIDPPAPAAMSRVHPGSLRVGAIGVAAPFLLRFLFQMDPLWNQQVTVACIALFAGLGFVAALHHRFYRCLVADKLRQRRCRQHRRPLPHLHKLFPELRPDQAARSFVAKQRPVHRR